MYMGQRISRYSVLILLCLSSVIATKNGSGSKIVGGSVTTIERYPFVAYLYRFFRYKNDMNNCAGIILTRNAILTSGLYLWDSSTSRLQNVTRWRARVGSSFTHTGGTLYKFCKFIVHPKFVYLQHSNNIGVARTKHRIKMIPNLVARAPLACLQYLLKDDQKLWTVGWGSTSKESDKASIQLKHVEQTVVNKDICKNIYGHVPYTAEFMCSNTTKGGICWADYGGPVVHKGVVVGVLTYNAACQNPMYPDLSTLVSYHVKWITATAMSPL